MEGKPMDEDMPFLQYMRQFVTTGDGAAWVVICITTALFAIDLFAGTNAIPLRDKDNPEKAAVLLAFSPLILFLLIVRLRQIYFSMARMSIVIRVLTSIVVFLLINF